MTNIDLLHTAINPVRVRETCHRACQRLGHPAKRDVQSLRDITVTKSLGAQEQALPVAFGKGANDGAKPSRAATVGELLFGIGGRIDHTIDEFELPALAAISPGCPF